jgi:hypothetical protein
LHLADLKDPLWCACRRRVHGIEGLQLFDVVLTFVKDDLTTVLVKDVKNTALFSHRLVLVARVSSRSARYFAEVHRLLCSPAPSMSTTAAALSLSLPFSVLKAVEFPPLGCSEPDAHITVASFVIWLYTVTAFGPPSVFVSLLSSSGSPLQRLRVTRTVALERRI